MASSQEGLPAKLESGKHVNPHFHLILSFITSGIWIPVRILHSVFGRLQQMNLMVGDRGFDVNWELSRPPNTSASENESAWNTCGRTKATIVMASALLVASIASSCGSIEDEVSAEPAIVTPGAAPNSTAEKQTPEPDPIQSEQISEQPVDSGIRA